MQGIPQTSFAKIIEATIALRAAQAAKGVKAVKAAATRLTAKVRTVVRKPAAAPSQPTFAQLLAQEDAARQTAARIKRERIASAAIAERIRLAAIVRHGIKADSIGHAYALAFATDVPAAQAMKALDATAAERRATTAEANTPRGKLHARLAQLARDDAASTDGDEPQNEAELIERAAVIYDQCRPHASAQAVALQAFIRRGDFSDLQSSR